MLGAIETIEQSEYNNPLALLGLGDAEMSNEFLGALRKLPITRQVAVMNQVTALLCQAKALVEKWKNISDTCLHISKRS